jgi:hypothetical protein
VGERFGVFAQAGERYVELPAQRPQTTFGNGLPVTSFSGTVRRAGGRRGAPPRTALRAQVTRLVRSGRSPLNPLTRVAAGLSRHF